MSIIDYQFAQPYYLCLLVPIFFFLIIKIKKGKVALQENTTLKLPQIATLKRHESSKLKWAKWAELLPFGGLIFAAIALARPQMPLREEVMKTEGIDIVLAIDLSLSMLSRDFEPDRLEVAKNVAATFIQKRKYDRIGLVTFSGEALTQCPVTSDHELVLKALEGLKSGILADGTAIGMGLATAVNRLKDSKAKSRVIILLTDGVNNMGYVNPISAAGLARSLGIRVYTIGVGTNGLALMPVARDETGAIVYNMGQVSIDEPTLMRVADISNGGRYFRAKNAKELSAIYDEIDTLEKTVIDTSAYKQQVELFYPFLLTSMLCFIIHFLLSNSIFKTFP